MILLYIGIGLLFLFLLSLALFSLSIYRRMFSRRYDGNPDLYYYTTNDFDCLQTEPFSFSSNQGQILRGFIYTSSHAENKLKGLIVFSHGFGAGHESYTTEINTLAQAGFTVVAFDNTGCVHSDGKRVNGFDQGPIDLTYALDFIQHSSRFSSFTGCYLVGHSWGGFTALNCIDHPFVKRAVSMCGFVSSYKVLAQVHAKQKSYESKARWKWYLIAPYLFLFNLVRFGKNSNCDSVRSLLKTNKPILLLYGQKDATVFYKNNGALLESSLKDKENIRFIAFKDKGHNVYLTSNAEKKMNETFKKIKATKKHDKEGAKRLYSQIDYAAITEEDPSIMREIIEFCKDS